MKIYLLLGSLLFSFSLSVEALTAHQYFEELLSKNTFLGHKNKYVCFPDEDTGGFSVLAKKQDNKENIKMTVRYKKNQRETSGHYLLEQVYAKGKLSEQNIYMKTDKNNEIAWLMKRSFFYHGQTIYKINWTTGRYRLLIYGENHMGAIPSYVENGNCELIQPINKQESE